MEGSPQPTLCLRGASPLGADGGLCHPRPPTRRSRRERRGGGKEAGTCDQSFLKVWKVRAEGAGTRRAPELRGSISAVPRGGCGDCRLRLRCEAGIAGRGR